MKIHYTIDLAIDCKIDQTLEFLRSICENRFLGLTIEFILSFIHRYFCRIWRSIFVAFQQHKNTKTTSKHYCHYTRDSIAIHNAIRCSKTTSKHYCHYTRDSIAIHNAIRCSVRKARAKKLRNFSHPRAILTSPEPHENHSI